MARMILEDQLKADFDNIRDKLESDINEALKEYENESKDNKILIIALPFAVGFFFLSLLCCYCCYRRGVRNGQAFKKKTLKRRNSLLHEALLEHDSSQYGGLHIGHQGAHHYPGNHGGFGGSLGRGTGGPVGGGYGGPVGGSYPVPGVGGYGGPVSGNAGGPVIGNSGGAVAPTI